MKYSVNEIIYPEGDRQEIQHSLSINQIVDINGFPVMLPLKTIKVIAYRVYKKTTREERNDITTSYYIQQLSLEELKSLL